MSEETVGQLVLGIDSSTQSTKVEVVDIATGATVETGRAAHTPTTPPVSEQDPRSWWEALLEALSQVKDSLPQVVAMAVAGQQHGMVLLDHKDRPVRLAKLWNDTTSAPQSEQMISAQGPAAWAKLCGSVPGPAFTVSKLAWMAEHEPEALANAVRIGLPHDYLNLRITGQWVTDRGDASGTGYWSPAQNAYVPEALAAAGVSVKSIELPRVANPFEPIGRVTDPELIRLGLGTSVVVGPGSGDNMAAALGLGMAPGDLAVSLGTSGTAYAVSPTPTADATGLVAGFADATGYYLPLVCTLNATKVTERIRILLGVEHGQFDQLALGAPIGANGLTLVPYFDGERTPNKPTATGALSGLRSTVSRGDLARAAIEGVTCGLLDGVDALRDCGVSMDGRFFLIGGGARSAAYRHSFAALAERPVIVPTLTETVARGAAVQAGCIHSGDDATTLALKWQLSDGLSQDVPRPSGTTPGAVRNRYRAEAASR